MALALIALLIFFLVRRRNSKRPGSGATAAAVGGAAVGGAAVGGAAAYGAYGGATQGPPGGAPSAPVKGPSGVSIATTQHAASAPPGGDIEAPLIGHRVMGARPAGETVLQDDYAMAGVKSEQMSSEAASANTTGVVAGDSRLVRYAADACFKPAVHALCNPLCMYGLLSHALVAILWRC